MNGACEEGARVAQVWKEIYNKTEKVNYNHPTKKAERERRLEPDFAQQHADSGKHRFGVMKPTVHPSSYIIDHGCIYPSIHDLHMFRAGVEAPKNPANPLKLPPVPVPEARPHHGSWFWPHGTMLNPNVESAVTMADSQAVFSQVAASRQAPSSLAASASAPQLGSSERRRQVPSALEACLPPAKAARRKGTFPLRTELQRTPGAVPWMDPRTTCGPVDLHDRLNAC